MDSPKILGILNVTPDSFSDGGLFQEPRAALARAMEMLREGADLLDIGAESTRPGAEPVSVDQELERLLPVLEVLLHSCPVPISTDTRHGVVARRSLEMGVEVINDISCARDLELLRAVAEYRAGYVLVHSRGEPGTMMEQAVYRDVVGEVREELRLGLETLKAAGIAAEHVAVDPGFGFAKTPEQNWELLRGLDSIAELGFPLLVGLSRKRMLRELVGTDAEALRAAGLTAACAAARRGANLFRTHDVAATKAALLSLQKLSFSLE